MPKDGGKNMNKLKDIIDSVLRTTIISLAMFFIVFSSASYATFKGEYLFQDNLSSSVPGAPDLVDLGIGSFASADVNGMTRQVFVFNEGEGLRLNTSGLLSNTFYTIVMLFELDDPNDGYNKILDFSNLVNDEGLYVYLDSLYFYNESQSPFTSFAPDIYAQVVLTRDSSGNVIGYVNGLEEIAFTDSSNFAEISNADFLIFFRDDDDTGNSENSSGSVACIEVYDEVLSASEIAQLDCLSEQQQVTGIPTLSEWGLIAMAGILGIAGFFMIRRRRVAI
jgi:hypothetical protein